MFENSVLKIDWVLPPSSETVEHVLVLACISYVMELTVPASGHLPHAVEPKGVYSAGLLHGLLSSQVTPL